MAAASLAVAGLMALSDFTPETTIAELDDGPATITVVVTACRPCSGGYLLAISDGVGGEATAFCPSDLLSQPLDSGTVARLMVQRSSQEPDFLYIESIVLTATSEKI
jgi:hypothetical protein